MTLSTSLPTLGGHRGSSPFPTRRMLVKSLAARLGKAKSEQCKYAK